MDARSARRGYRSLIEDAGADALELNVYYLPTSVELSGREVENIYLDMLSQVKEAVTIPLAMKLSPFFSSIAHMSKRLIDEGASGLVFFNRFYQPDFDLDKLEVAPRLVLSNSNELRLPLRWVAILYGRRPSNYQRRSYFRRCLEGPDGRRQGNDDGFRVVTEWRAPNQRDTRRNRSVDGHPRVRVSGPDDRQHEPKQVRRACRIRARELHEDSRFVPADQLKSIGEHRTQTVI